MPNWYRSALFRSALLLPLFFSLASLPWGEFAGAPYVPIRLALPFARHLFHYYVLWDPSEDSRTAAVFLKEQNLRNLAVPTSHGGPKNQMIFVVSGYAVLGTITLIGIPLTPIQCIGLVLAVSSTVGFIVSMTTVEAIPFDDLELAPIAHAASAAIALICIIVMG
jgi:hypothetical protein